MGRFESKFGVSNGLRLWFLRSQGVISGLTRGVFARTTLYSGLNTSQLRIKWPHERLGPVRRYAAALQGLHEEQHRLVLRRLAVLLRCGAPPWRAELRGAHDRRRAVPPGANELDDAGGEAAPETA